MDVEALGPYPGDYSMNSLGAVAFDEDAQVIGAFEVNLLPLQGSTPCPDTMRNFWMKEEEAWEYCTRNPKEPKAGMQSFAEWVISLPGDLKTGVCMPAAFDYMFIYWYLKKFVGRSPLSFSCLDTKSYVCAMRKKPYRHSAKRSWPKRWFTKLPHTHKAMDDALEQGVSFMLMRAENLNGKIGLDEELARIRHNALSSWAACTPLSLIGERAPGDPVPIIDPNEPTLIYTPS